MSIIKTYDNTSEEILQPSLIYPKIQGFPEVAVATFRLKTAEMAAELFDGEVIGTLYAGFSIPIYKIHYHGKAIAIYFTPMGGPIAVGLLEEVIAIGAKKAVFFGSCGTLDRNLPAETLIVPTAAYRDEGTSYHYMAASDYVEVPTAGKLCGILDELHEPYICGKTWTTDGLYRETRKNMQARRQEGCITVDMECASVMAAGSFRGAEIYQYLYTEDNLDDEAWDARTMGKILRSTHERYLNIALEIACRVSVG